VDGFATGLVSHAEKQEQYLVLAVRGGVAEPESSIKAAPDPRLFAESGPGRGPGGGKGKAGKKDRPQ